MRKIRHWTKEEEKILRNWIDSGSVNREKLMVRLKRNWNSIDRKLRNLGLKLPLVYDEIILKKDKEIAQLERQVRDLIERDKIHIVNYYDKICKVGVVGDTQIGSLYQRLDVLNAAYDVFEKEGVAFAVHTGDFVDGERMFRQHARELYAHGFDAQLHEVAKRYPKKKFKTYFITGNHDLCYYASVGSDIGEHIAEARPDLIYLGQEQADMVVGRGKRTVKIRLFHPRKGTAYAISYRSQKSAEAISGGQKPHILLMGHTHKAEHLPCERNIAVVQTGCCQSQTPFMKGKEISAHLGFWLLEFTTNPPELVSRFKASFYATYEDEPAYEI